jgi:hypothetical protein
MPALNLCSRCRGFLPPGASRCVHCGDDSCPSSASRVRTFVGGLVLAATAGTMALTLMACYGMPPCEDDGNSDGDGDGYHWYGCTVPDDTSKEDCNDGDASIHPGADDPRGDGIDQNCDGVDGIHASPGVAGSGGTAGSGGSAGSGGAAGAGGNAGSGGAAGAGAGGGAGASGAAGAGAGGNAGSGGVGGTAGGAGASGEAGQGGATSGAGGASGAAGASGGGGHGG